MLQKLSDIWDGRSVPQTSPYLDDNDSSSMVVQSLFDVTLVLGEGMVGQPSLGGLKN